MDILKAKQKVVKAIDKTSISSSSFYEQQVNADINGELWYSDQHAAVNLNVDPEARAFKYFLPEKFVPADLILNWEYINYKDGRKNTFCIFEVDKKFHFVNKKYIRPFMRRDVLASRVTIWIEDSDKSYLKLFQVLYNGKVEIIVLEWIPVCYDMYRLERI